MLIKNKIIRFFEDREALKIAIIKKEAGIYAHGVEYYLKRGRSLEPRHIERLTEVLKKYGWED